MLIAQQPSSSPQRASLQEGWVIANHILVSFHVAFISSVLALPDASVHRGEVLQHVFFSTDTLLSALFMFLTFHTGIALHELGHFLTAARLNALNEAILEGVNARLSRSWPSRLVYYFGLYLRIPYGKAVGVKREGLNYYPDAPYNLAVAAAGPRASRNVALIALPPAIGLLAFGILADQIVPLDAGRLLLGVGIVSLLDFLLADPGKYAAFRQQEATAAERARSVQQLSGWLAEATKAKEKMATSRMQRVTHPRLGPVTAPWQFRNCGMGGRHTEKEYPESNISMQEAMFLILRARDYVEAQEMTVRLQNRLKEIIEKEEGCRVMGIGLEGGLAPYIDRGDYPMPEVRLWAMMKQAMIDCGFQPGRDVAIALDPALSELEIAYREEFEVPDAIGQYLFWRDKAKIVLDRDGVLALYLKAMRDYEIPILSIEDGFAEDDHEGWKQILAQLGDRIFIIGDDLVTTNDKTIEHAADQGLINAALIKANQIGSLYETLLAMLVALGKGHELVVSHRSKSPNDDMEAQIALAVNSLGLKAGGGSNTERLVKYQSVVEQMLKAEEPAAQALREGEQALICKLRAYEESTNAGIPTVGATVELRVGDAGVALRARGATPLGTSAGTGEAIHLVDALIEADEHPEVIKRFRELFAEAEPGVHKFKKGVDEARIRDAGSEELAAVYRRAQRYGGKGCLNAVDNVAVVIAPYFEGRDAAALSLKEIDRALLALELRTAIRRGKLAPDASEDERVRVMQRKQNLGMNAMLSSSLALARAVAQIQGRELYELLREELLAIIEELAARYGVQIGGSRFEDYVAALRAATTRVAAEGRQLHAVLRELTGIYSPEDAPRAAAAPRAPEAPAPAPVAPSLATAEVRRVSAAVPGIPPARPFAQALSPEEAIALEGVHRAFFRACGDGAGEFANAVRLYQRVKARLAHHFGNFGIANNRLFKLEQGLIIPYVAGNALVVYLVERDTAQLVAERQCTPGQIFNDGLITQLAGREGSPVDIEEQLVVLRLEDQGRVNVARLADMAALLQRVNGCVNRNEAVYWLRHLAARLCSKSLMSLLRAKNLQPEVNQLVGELVHLLNGSLAPRLPLLMRVIVRNLSTLIGKPNLIDQLWNDTIALAEVHIRGSAIVNELRRSSHHQLGERTLQIGQAYLQYLRSGETAQLVELGFDGPSAADEAARAGGQHLELVARVVGDLESLLGTTNTATRLREWQRAYASTLLRCDFGKSIVDELETIAAKGIEERNRWAFAHHLRILQQKARSFSGAHDVVEPFLEALGELETLKPDAPDFDAARTEKLARDAISAFVDGLKQAFIADLFANIDGVLTAYEQHAFYQTVTLCHQLRGRVHAQIARGGFPEKRFMLQQLDCLLEEMGYFAARHLGATYGEDGVRLDECLDVIRLCALNLLYDGVQSRELWDLTGMLGDPTRTPGELLNVVESIERCYHRIRQRVTWPYEKMRERLELSEEELRAVLANMQRYLHDLNTMVSFSNIVEQRLRAQLQGTPPASAVAPDRGPMPAIVHISHRAEIVELLQRGPEACNLRRVYGGKGSGLLYINYLNIPTCDGFILPTAIPRRGVHKREPQRLEQQITEHLAILERDIESATGRAKRFADPAQPLLLAVRGGSVFSMPGILSTIVFVGMNDEIAATLAADDPWRAYDSYRRFLESYASTVWGFDLDDYRLVDAAKKRHGAARKMDMPWEAMKEVAEASKTILRDNGFGEQLDEVLADPRKQLCGAVLAVIESWDTDTARRFREIKGLCHSWHTAVIVQQMAFGNRINEEIVPGMDEARASLTGVIPHTREEDTGVRQLTGEIKFSAAGDDLVGGVIASHTLRSLDNLEELMPMLHRRLRHIVAKLRRLHGMDQEIEFTVDSGVLSVLQARTAASSHDLAPDRFCEPGEPISRGLGVRGGCFRGLVAFDDAEREALVPLAAQREDVDGVLMVLENPTPEDIPVIISADGLLTQRGGSTSHAAVAANSVEDKPFSAVMSAQGLRVNEQKREARFVDGDGQPIAEVHKGDVIAIHGTTGEVYLGSRAVDRLPPRAVETSSGAGAAAAAASAHA